MNILTCYYCTDEAIEVATIPDKRQDELLAEFERRAKVSLALIIIIIIITPLLITINNN